MNTVNVTYNVTRQNAQITLPLCIILSRPTGVYNQAYRFCLRRDGSQSLRGGTEVIADNCSRSAYNIDFTMYGGTALTQKSIPLYNYHNGFLASRLSLTNEPYILTENNIHSYNQNSSTVYVPGELNVMIHVTTQFVLRTLFKFVIDSFTQPVGLAVTRLFLERKV